MLFINKKIVLKPFLTLLFLITTLLANSQCFEIESILVDACGSPEGENEMVRFKVGSSSLNLNNMSVDWASSNSWLGLCQNGTTAGVVSSLNSSITGCGLLIEPTSNILPANASVIFMTSTALDVSANSFTNLNDTLIVIFQCAGNTQGHFANGSGTGLRTLSISFSSPVCSDEVTYDKGPLDNNEGASVSFNSAGTPTYYNNGCQAPIDPISITGDILPASTLTICPGDSINLFSSTVGAIQSIKWIGNYGSFNNSNSDTTTYYSSLNDTLPFQLFIGGITSCNDTIFDTLDVNISLPIYLSIDEENLTTFCSGTSLTIHTSSNANTYSWNDGSNLDSLNIFSSGEYWITGSNGICPSISDTITIVNEILPSAIIIGDSSMCTGSSIVLNASGIGSFSWSTGSSGISTLVNSSQSVTLISTNNCGTTTTDNLIITEEDCDINTDLIIPNVFSPNNDDENDIFKVIGPNISSINGKIFNRWGQLLYQWNDQSSGWDGNGAPSGSYFYIIEVSFISKESQVFKGTLSLLK